MRTMFVTAGICIVVGSILVAGHFLSGSKGVLETIPQIAKSVRNLKSAPFSQREVTPEPPQGAPQGNEPTVSLYLERKEPFPAFNPNYLTKLIDNGARDDPTQIVAPLNDASNEIEKRVKIPLLLQEAPNKPLHTFFPMPPPVPSATRTIHASALPVSIHTYSDLSNFLETKLSDRGYREFRYYGIGDDGFALITRLERIDNSGHPLEGDARWPHIAELDSVELTRHRFSLIDYILALFRPGERPELSHYRIFVFLVTPQIIFPNPKTEVDKNLVIDWETLGSLSLDAEHASKLLTKNVNLSVLIYELVPTSAKTVKLAVPSALPGDVHLAAAGLILERQP